MADDESIFDAAKGGGTPKGGAMKTLKPELQKCIDKWGKEIKVTKGPKGTPFPLTIQRTIPQTEAAAAWDVDHIVLVLRIEGNEHAKCRAVCPPKAKDQQMPPQLCRAVAEMITAKWQKQLAKEEDGNTQNWNLNNMFKWTEKKYLDLIRLSSGIKGLTVEIYEGTAPDGSGGDRTSRRFTIQAEEEDDEVDEEEAARLAAEEKKKADEAEAYYNEKEMERIYAAAKLKDKDAAEKRKKAEDGLEDPDRPVRLSKKAEKERLDAKRNKAGQRTAKTGQKRSKAPEGDKHANKEKGKADAAKERQDRKDKEKELESKAPGGSKKAQKAKNAKAGGPNSSKGKKGDNGDK